jgi:hypothetical protein
MVSVGRMLGNLHTKSWPVADGLARLITLENVRRVQGVRFRRVSRRKECRGGRRLGVERLKWLSQIL